MKSFLVGFVKKLMIGLDACFGMVGSPLWLGRVSVSMGFLNKRGSLSLSGHGRLTQITLLCNGMFLMVTMLKMLRGVFLLLLIPGRVVVWLKMMSPKLVLLVLHSPDVWSHRSCGHLDNVGIHDCVLFCPWTFANRSKSSVVGCYSGSSVRTSAWDFAWLPGQLPGLMVLSPLLKWCLSLKSLHSANEVVGIGPGRGFFC